MLGDLGGQGVEDFGTGEQLELGIFGEGEVSRLKVPLHRA